MEEKLKDYAKSMVILYRMLHKRGYIIPEDKHERSLEDTITYMKQPGTTEKQRCSVANCDLTITCFRAGPVKDHIMVFFLRDSKVTAGKFNECIGQVRDQDATRCVLVIGGEMTPSALKLARAFDDLVTLEVFYEEEVLFDITEHNLQPEFRVLTEEETEELLKEYEISVYQLPAISKADPIARFYGLDPKQVIKITRKNQVSGSYYTYRVCI
ncbi:unnamed protein product [Moneuplotes crassus]|uniref:RNA polymerase subunit H/Rpb5 C-terminal domain-containing protein n=1 Tax=Euplotes crassus TaxID=5936 RepID=A0AAD1XWA4_EUPCR|nr:unnamed protein product [Moneuplotes crassus]